MAMRKTNANASVAAQLIDDASHLSHVPNDSDVQVAREAVSEKVQARTVAALTNIGLYVLARLALKRILGYSFAASWAL
jgi:hypothetical protein